MSCVKLKIFLSDFLKYFSSFSDLAKNTIVKKIFTKVNIYLSLKMSIHTRNEKVHQKWS